MVPVLCMFHQIQRSDNHKSSSTLNSIVLQNSIHCGEAIRVESVPSSTLLSW
jgi:hypothetical protein